MLIQKSHLSLYDISNNVRIEAFFEYSINITHEEESKKMEAITVFLSHKHNDGEILDQVIVMHTNLGVRVYIDWMDDEMPNETSGEYSYQNKEKNQIKNLFY